MMDETKLLYREETRRLTSLIDLSEQEADVLFNTAVFDCFDGFNFKNSKYRKLNPDKLEKLCEKLDLFFRFVRGKGVFTIKEVINEIRGIRIKLDHFKTQAKKNEKQKKRKDYDPNSSQNIKKDLFYRALDKFRDIFTEMKGSIYIPQNQEVYEMLEGLAKMSFDLRDQESPSATDMRLIAIAFYRSLLENKETNLASKNKHLFNLLVRVTNMISFNPVLYSQVRSYPIRLYRPWMGDGRRYSLALDTEDIKTYSNPYRPHKDEVRLALEGILDCLPNF